MDNITRLNDIIGELESRVETLKEQSEIATKYLEYKKELEQNEIGLLAYDIKEINDSYLVHKESLELSGP